jgi:hypothetical protein
VLPQIESLLEPCNAKAIYWTGYVADPAANRGNGMGDTERSTKEWMSTLENALNWEDPPPIIEYITGEGDEEVEHTLALTIEDFAPLQPESQQLQATPVLPPLA